MRKSVILSLSALVVAGLVFMIGFTGNDSGNEYAAHFETGAPDHMAIGELAFGPEGILFYGDSPGASLYAMETEAGAADAGEPLNVSDVADKIAQTLGAAAEDISIQDMAVHPISGQAWISLSRGEGNNASWHMMTVSADGSIEEVGLENVSFSKFELSTAPGPDATNRRGQSLRSASITDLSFAGGKVYVAGISNEEFSSGFRQVNFPFGGEEALSTLEIYHVSHGQYETNAPIRTFVPYAVNGSNYIVAGYTCTPLVLFPMDNLGDGEHVRGKTVAELGNRNRPLDIIPYTDSSGSESLVIANSSYSVMKVDPAQFDDQPHLDQPLEEGQHTKGVEFEELPYEDVLHMDKLEGEYLVMLQQQDDGSVDLKSVRN